MRTRRAAGARHPGSRALSDLPDHLLELCLPCKRDDAWRLSNLRLVCKRWKGIFDGSLRLLTYGCFHVWPEHLLGKGTGASPAPAVLDTAALVRLAACLAAVVQEACIEEAHKPGRLEAVEQLPHLVSLMLTAHSDYCNEQPGLVLAQRQLGLGALPQLRQLSLHVSGLLGPTCQQLAAARHLTSLEAGDLLYQVPDALWDAVACLPNLVVLEVHVHAAPEGTIIPSLAWQRLAACTRLACLRLLNCYVSGGADEYGYFALQSGITQLTALRSFVAQGCIASLGDLWQHTGLTQLELLDSHDDFAYPPRSSFSLPALRSATVGIMKQELVPFWDGLLSSTLRHVTFLRLQSCCTEWAEEQEDEDWALEQLGGLLQMGALHSLRLEGSLCSIPDSVRCLRTLKLLDVSDCCLRELPEGRYLLGLRTLLMPGHRMQWLPPALATARSLELLDVTPSASLWRRKPKAGVLPLLLQPADLSLLAAMPALRVLCLPLSSEAFQGDKPRLQSAVNRQWLLAKVFTRLLPQLVVMPFSAASGPRLFLGASFEGGLDPAMLQQLQAHMQSNWAALSQEAQHCALAMLRCAADAQRLSPKAAALLAAFVPNNAGQGS